MKNIEVKEICYWSALFGRSNRSKNSRSHFKLILCCFKPNISSQTKFNQNRMKNTEVEKSHYLSASVGRLGRPKNSHSHFKLILCCSLPNISPYNKFYSNQMKNTEVQNFRDSRNVKKILKIRKKKKKS